MVLNLHDMATTICELKKRGHIIVLCHGCFDLLHIGHVRHFAEAANQGGILCVTITPDKFVGKGPGRPVFNEDLRAEMVDSIYCVDFVAINRWPTAVEAIKLIKPAIYCKGAEYASGQGNIQAEEEAVKSVGGRIHFTEGLVFSSTELLAWTETHRLKQ